jgi:hypothetical protein
MAFEEMLNNYTKKNHCAIVFFIFNNNKYPQWPEETTMQIYY